MSAFGKQTTLLRNIPSFRQLSGQFGGIGGKRQSRGGRPYWVDQYIPPLIDADTILLIPGGYESMEVDESTDPPSTVPVSLPFVKFIEHYDGRTERSSICSAGPFVRYKDLRNPCNGCDIYWATLEPTIDDKGKERKKSSRMSRQTKFGFGMIDFSNYHKQPQFDGQTGQPRINPRTKQQYYDWVKCTGSGCDGCKAKLETKFGHNPHWPMSWGFFETIRAQDREVGNSCRNCKNKNTIQSLAWVCKNCGEAAIDMSTTQLKPEDVVKISESHYSCKCGHKDFLNEIIECRACANAERMTVFDAEFRVRRVTTGGNNQSVLSISGWEPARALTGPLAELAKPQDLIKKFEPTPNAIQLKLFGPPPLADGTEPAQQAERSRPYGEQYR
jgi:hypothetical protein